MKRFNYIILICAVASFMASCDKTIHQYPHLSSVKIVIEPHVDDNTHHLYKDVSYDENWNRFERSLSASLKARNMKLDSDHLRRVVTEVRSGTVMGKGELIRHKESLVDIDERTPADTVEVRLSLGDYHVVSWSDYVGKTRSVEYFKLDGLSKIIANTDMYPDNIGFRCSYGGTKLFDIDYDDLENGACERVNLDLNAGRFVLVASDYEQYRMLGGDIDDLRIRVVYRQYINNGYSVATRTPNNFISSYEFVTSAHDDFYYSDHEDAIVSDYIFVEKDKETVVLVDFFFYSASTGKEINHCQGIEVPLSAGKETIIRAYCLTKEFGKGEIGIDETFGGEHLIEI